MSTTAPVNETLKDGHDEGLLMHLMSYYGAYHNHKETMAFSIFGLEGAFFIGLFSFANWPESIARMDKPVLTGIFVVVWVLFHGALRFQLRARRLAAIIAAALYDSLSGRVDLTFRREDYAVATEDKTLTFIDQWVFPVRRAIRPSDVELPLLPDGTVVRPATLGAYRLHLAARKSAAQKTWSDYALPIEYVSTVGSILMLAIALFRVITLTPLPVPSDRCDCAVVAPAAPAPAASAPAPGAFAMPAPASAAASR